MIEVQNLHVRFNPDTPLERHALRGVELTLKPGEFLTLIGSNGAGKSTLLHCLAGRRKPNSGHISFFGKSIGSLSIRERAKRVAQIFQDPLAGTCAELTIAENLALAWSRGKKRGLWPALTHNKRSFFADRLAVLELGLESRLDDRVGLLSGGQRQALTLVMASLMPSELLLLDEHTAALDPLMSKLVLELTRKLVEDNKITCLMVTHSLRWALEYGSRMVMLDEGRVMLDASGAERDALTPEKLMKQFETRADMQSRGLLER